MTTARIDTMLRASDPVFEFGFKLYLARLEDRIWNHTLTRLAERFGVVDPQVQMTAVLVDRRRQWKEFGNVGKNSVIRSLLRRDKRG